MSAQPAADAPRTAPGTTPATDASAPPLDPAIAARLTALVVAGPDAERVESRTPLTGAWLADLPMSTTADVETAIQRARAAQQVWAERSVEHRAAVLLRLHDLILERQSAALDLIQLESGKARLHAFEEVADVAINARWYARRGKSLLADARRRGITPVLTQVTQVHHPKGVIGIIAPWNYPLTLAISDALPALLAGNAVVIKPDRSTVLTALWGAEQLADAGLPDGLFQVVHGAGSVLGTAMIERCDHICFTGSTATGRLVAEQAGRRLIGVSLELGGKNSLYVAEDADLDRAAEAAVRDCFASAGQLCVSIERLLIHERVIDAFLDRFVDRVRRLRLGAELDFSADFGSLVSADQLKTVSAHVDDAVAKGAKVLAGGRARPDVGPMFYEPTVLTDVPPEAICHQEETFGPLVSVYPVASDGEALAIANTGEYGLNASVWTKDLGRGRRLARQVRAGTVAVNEAFIATWGSVASPMGGHKDSGLGRRHGAEGLLRFTESQTVAVQRGIGFGPMYAAGGERMAAVFTTGLRLAKRLHVPWP
jgi:succinate-semialdehyde dehydrogenase/glutarate-semialdehyde dehydrogenase